MRGSTDITSHGQAVRFILDLVREDARPYGSRGTQSMDALLEALEHPEAHLAVIHIAGSKGKGSTALMIERILAEVGFHTGTFTSPHLTRWNERFRIEEKPIDNDVFTGLFTRLAPLVAKVTKASKEAPTFFDVLTAAALMLFREQRVDYAIVETGLGGRFDSTVVVEPSVCVITTIEKEHMQKLGTSLRAIASHKAGIIKNGVPVVCGDLPPEAMAVIRAVARERRAPLSVLGEDFHCQRIEQSSLAQTLRYESDPDAFTFTLPHPTTIMATNAALAIATVQKLLPAVHGPSIGDSLSNVVLPGRGQVLVNNGYVVIDGAHTIAAIENLCELLDGLPIDGRKTFVLSTTYDKDPRQLFAPIIARANTLIVTQADAARTLEASVLANAFEDLNPSVVLKIQPDPVKALAAAAAKRKIGDLICVTGSMYLAGLALDPAQGFVNP